MKNFQAGICLRGRNVFWGVVWACGLPGNVHDDVGLSTGLCCLDPCDGLLISGYHATGPPAAHESSIPLVASAVPRHYDERTTAPCQGEFQPELYGLDCEKSKPSVLFNIAPLGGTSQKDDLPTNHHFFLGLFKIDLRWM